MDKIEKYNEDIERYNRASEAIDRNKDDIIKNKISKLWIGFHSIELRQDKLRHEVQKLYAATGLGFVMVAVVLAYAYWLAVV